MLNSMISSRIKNWFRLGIEYLIASGFGQVLGLLSGFLYVRYMPVEQYALYGLCLTTLSFVSLASDLGLTGSTTYFWRFSREHSVNFIAFFKEIERLRLWLFSGVILVAAIALFVLGLKRGFGLGEVALSFSLIAATAWLGIYISIDLQVLRLLEEYRRTYFAQLSGQAIRFMFAVVLAVGLASSAAFGLVGGAVGALVTWRMVKNGLTLEDMRSPGEDPEQPRKALLGYMVPVAPSVVIFSLQDTILFWFVTLQGSKIIMAEVFALGRYLGVIGIINLFVIVVIIPRISGILDAKAFHRASLQVRALLLIAGLSLIWVCWTFPGFVLFVLGEQYMHLSVPLRAVSVLGMFTILNSATVLMNRARGWVMFDSRVALLQLVILCTVLFVIDFKSTVQIILAQSMLVGASLLMNTVINMYGFYNPEVVSSK